MTTATPWEIVGTIAAHDDTRDLWRQSTRWIWRILLDDGTLTAPGSPYARTTTDPDGWQTGTLIRRPTVAHITGDGRNIGVAALSKGPL